MPILVRTWGKWGWAGFPVSFTSKIFWTTPEGHRPLLRSWQGCLQVKKRGKEMKSSDSGALAVVGKRCVNADSVWSEGYGREYSLSSETLNYPITTFTCPCFSKRTKSSNFAVYLQGPEGSGRQGLDPFHGIPCDMNEMGHQIQEIWFNLQCDPLTTLVYNLVFAIFKGLR